MSSFGGNNSSNNGNNRSGDDDEGWGTKFFKVASAAAVAGGLYTLLTSSSSTPNSEPPFKSRASRAIEDPDDDDDDDDDDHALVKLNVAGSRDHISHPRSSGCGGVLRDSSGKWLLGFAKKLDPSLEVHETEIEAILKGLELAFNMNMNIEKLVVESDHKSAVSMVENGVKYNHPQFNIISRIRKLCFHTKKWEVKIVHVPREANKVANRLAKYACDLPFEHLQKYPRPPDAICAALVEEDARGRGSKFFKAASAAGDLYALLKSSSSTPNSEPPFKSRASRVIEDPDDDDDDDHALVKLNVAGSHDHISHPRSSGCGGVLRDLSGKWLLGFAQKLDPSLEVHETEIEAILKGLELAWDMNIKKLVVESDHKSAVSVVENGLGAKYNHPQFNIISRIRKLCFDTKKWEVKVVHVPREANRVANRLAKYARDLPFQHLQKYPRPPDAICAALVEEDAQGWGSKFFKYDDDPAWSLHPNDESIPSSQNIRWTKPESGWVKLNVDGSRDHISHPPSSGCGGVLRDASGKWLLGFAQKLPPSLEVDETEIVAILKGLELTWDMNIKKLVVESDLESAVSMVENGLGAKYNRKQFDIISRIRELRFDPKWEVKVVYVPRKANKVANRLANDARGLLFEHLQGYLRPPDNCTALVEEDAQSLSCELLME